MNELVIHSLYWLAGIVAYASAYHLFYALRQPRDRMQMLFAAMCLSAVPFAIFHAQTLQATNTIEFVQALKGSLASIFLVFLLFTWFIALYTRKILRPFLVGISVLLALLFVVNLIQPYSLQYDQLDGIRTLQMPWGELITRGNGHSGAWTYSGAAVYLVVVGYALYALGGVYRRFRRRTDFYMLLAVVLFLICSTESVLARLSIINFIETGPFGLLAVVIVMSVLLNRETQQRLHTSERNFRLLFENSPTAMVAIDPTSGLIVQANNLALKLTGYSAEEIQKMTMADLSHPDDRAKSMQRFEQISKGLDDSLFLEKRYLRKDGSSFLGYTSVSTLKGEDGKVISIIGSTIDITERKRTNEALEASLEFSKNLISSMQDGFSVLDTNGRAMDANPAFCDMTGFSLDEFIGLNAPFPYWPPEEYENIQAAFQKTLKGDVGNFELTFMRKSGERFPVIVSSSVVKDRNGSIISYTATVKDITERKRIEEAFLKANERLELAQNTSGSGVWELNITTGHFDWSLELYKVFGLDPTKDVSGIELWQSILHPEDIVVAEERFERAVREGTQLDSDYRIVRRDGAVRWINTLGRTTYDELSQQLRMTGICVDITERKQASAEIERLAYHDPLTRLPNRLLLIDRLKQALVSSARIGRAGALLFIDLDNFKSLNDTLGHDIGDLLLQQVSQRLESCIREGDTVARLGGDEFVVMLLDLSEQPIEAAAQTEAIGEKILAALSQTYLLSSHEYHCTASVGVTLFSDNQQGTDEIMKQADIAMYQAKKAGRNALRFFDRQMQENISARVSLENELHKALEFQQFHLYYQIQVDSSHRRLGAEALIRWIHPERGLVSPAHFIPLAEETGLILPIGQWVLEMACLQLKAWQKDAITRELVLSINVSAKQFRQTNFVGQVQSAVQQHAINPKLLKLELTESLLQENIEETIAVMTLLHVVGVQFSLDDFGTGYSSLQYLKRLPLDQLKIDQSFVRDLDADSSDKAIVRTIIAMAQSLGLEVIAEGVETEEQRKLLMNKGCTNFQGYLFGRPVPIRVFEEMLRQG